MNHIYVDVEIAVDRNLSLLEAHKIAEDVHLEVEKEFDALHCMVHVNPYKSKYIKYTINYIVNINKIRAGRYSNIYLFEYVCKTMKKQSI